MRWHHREQRRFIGHPFRATRHRIWSATQRDGDAAAAGDTAVALTILAFARADRILHPERYADGGMNVVIGSVMAVVGLQIGALTATVGRLSAAVRTRRLSNLRMLGLTAGRTRIVAAVEVGVAATVGAAAGVAVFLACRPVLGRLHAGGVRWTSELLHPGPLAMGAVPVVTVVLTIALAALPDRFDPRTSASRVRGGPSSAPSKWRLIPLVVGIVACVLAQRSQAGQSDGSTWWLIPVAVLSLGIGVALVVPVFVHLVASGLARVASGPAVLIAARRLRAQPAGMNRAIAGLLVGLFVVTGARSVVAAFEDTPQYRGAAIAIERHQMLVTSVDSGEVVQTVRATSRVAGVRTVTALPVLQIDECDGEFQGCPSAIVATCEQVRTVMPTATGCVPDTVQWFHQTYTGVPVFAPNSRWEAGSDGGPTIPALNPTSPIGISDIEPLFQGRAILIPPDTPGVSALISRAPHQILIVGDPGRDLPERLAAAGAVDDTFFPWPMSDYDFAVSLRLLANTVAVVVLSLGLLAFAIAAIDRAANRRSDVASLLLIGASPSSLRRTQLVEAGVPIVGGSILAIGLGFLAGTTYLAWGGSANPPTGSAVVLAVCALIGGVAVAGLTVIAASPTLDTTTIRRA